VITALKALLESPLVLILIFEAAVVAAAVLIKHRR
jgi:hypothetical protein